MHKRIHQKKKKYGQNRWHCMIEHGNAFLRCVFCSSSNNKIAPSLVEYIIICKWRFRDVNRCVPGMRLTVYSNRLQTVHGNRYAAFLCKYGTNNKNKSQYYFIFASPLKMNSSRDANIRYVKIILSALQPSTFLESERFEYYK